MFATTTLFPLVGCAAFALADTLGYDPNYGTGSNSLAITSCSDGQNGLLTKGFTTFDSLPTFPRIFSSPTVGGWNSDKCGACYAVTYNGGAAEYFTAMDHAGGNYYTSLQALNDLTNGYGQQAGTVQVSVTEVDRANCGF
ncbi:Asp f 13-like protein [Cylindrobasidium torrendii FP15055 ss-10]|uniref:Asp f 13-like protein n=1 Tax=Cylindrobasidium torrendii FP15055 ss-10 TaxID=1314674 RepID=A0A0D7BGJ8_9AGAR|nr:Asp f 13-like protein [Cylindrobasidium torrendii FP15055 ss-10]